MPLYLDVHNKVDGLSAQMDTEAHKKDLAVQGKYGVNYIRYWYDEGTGKVFCLVVPVPDEVHAVLALHGQIFLVGLGSHLGGEAIDLVVDIQVERHGPTLLSYGGAPHREQLRASKSSWAPV